MTDFLTSLVSRSLGAAAAIRPRVALLFEPAFPHSEPPADVSRVHEADSASGEPERAQARRDLDLALRDEPAPERQLTFRPDPEERATRARVAVPAPPPAVPAASALPASPLPMRRVPVEEETQRPRHEPEPHNPRRDEVAPALTVATATRSIGVRPEPTEVAAVRKEFKHGEERGLLVPSKSGARVAAELHSTVSASHVTSRDRGAGLERVAENHHAIPERNVHVTIGRIEVRATSGEQTPARERPASPVMGLDEYLRRQSRRGGQ